MAHDIGRRDHAYFHRIGPDVFEHRIYLGDDERRINIHHSRNAERVLRRQRCDSARGEKTVSLDGLDISLNAGSTARIGARDGEDGSHGYRPRSPRA